jgi:hypothetical protein
MKGEWGHGTPDRLLRRGRRLELATLAWNIAGVAVLALAALVATCWSTTVPVKPVEPSPVDGPGRQWVKPGRVDRVPVNVPGNAVLRAGPPVATVLAAILG